MTATFMVPLFFLALASGDAETQALVRRMFQQEGTSLVRLARIFTDDRNAAEDIVQEAFIRLHRNAGKVKDPDKTAAYLRSIVLNLARDHNRRGLLSLRHQQTQTIINQEGADEQVFRDDSQARVVEALGKLSSRQRDCLVLRYFMDLSERDIAETLGISPNSVKTHTRRGMTTLETLLEDEQ